MMFKNTRLNKNSIIAFWLVSYIIILLAPILVSIFSYINTVKVVEDEIYQSNMFLLERLQKNFDKLLKDSERLSVDISFKSNVQRILSMQVPPNDENYYTIYEVYRDLQSYMHTYTFIDDCYIAFKNIGMIISLNGVTDFKTYFDSYYKNSGMSYEKWMEIIGKEYNGEYILLPDRTGQKDNMFTYIRSIPLTIGKKTTGNLFVSFDKHRFIQDAIGINSTGEGSVLLLHGNGDILISTNNEKFHEQRDYNGLPGNEGRKLLEINNENLVVSYITSQITGFKYISVIPYRVILSKLGNIRNIAIIISFICLILEGLIIVFSLKRNYNPIHRLIQAVESGTRSSFDKKVNEFSYLEKSLLTIFNEKNNIENKLAQQKIALRKQLLAKLLHGRVGMKADLNNYLGSFQVYFKSDYFSVILFYIHEIGNGFVSYGKDDYELVRFILTNIIEEVLGRKNSAYMLEIEDMVACLVNYGDDRNAQDINDVLESIAESSRFIKNHFNIEFSAALSDINKGIESIHKAYEEARLVMEYKMVMNIHDNLCYFSLPKDEIKYQSHMEIQLVNSIKAGDWHKTEEVIRDIFDNSFSNSTPSLIDVQCFMYSLVSTIVKTFGEIRRNIGEEYKDFENDVNLLIKCKNVSELKNIALALTKKLCLSVEKQAQDDEPKLKDVILKYIQDNYSHTDINISTIAYHVGMHPVYVSQIFKEQTGESLLDYIHRIRIEKAKILLKQQTDTIDKIAGVVGYSNTRSFIRAFKKHEGINPGQYRNIK